MILDFNLTELKEPFKKPFILLCPQIPAPLHGLNPRTVKGTAWWDIQRKKAYAGNSWCCWACGVGDCVLEAHEIYKYDFKECSAKLEYICALCKDCHMFIHLGRTQLLREQKKISISRYMYLVRRSIKLLKKARLYSMYERMETQSANYALSVKKTWKKWHLIIDGKKHSGKFESVEEWALHDWGK